MLTGLFTLWETMYLRVGGVQDAAYMRVDLLYSVNSLTKLLKSDFFNSQIKFYLLYVKALKLVSEKSKESDLLMWFIGSIFSAN